VIEKEILSHKIWSLQRHHAEKFYDGICICDSGASPNYCVLDRSMSDVGDINENFRVGNGSLLVATKIGSLKFMVI
jgi:hypothetical protein